MKLFKKRKSDKIQSAPTKKRRILANPKILEVDLIKGESGHFLNWRKYLVPFFLAMITALVLTAEVYLLLTWWEKQEIERSREADDDFLAVSRDIRLLREEYQEFTDFQRKADIVAVVIDEQAYWTDFFNWLEKRTLSSVNWHSFSGGLEGDYNLAATARTYADISWQVRSFLDDELVKSVEVDQGQGGLQEHEDEEGNITVSSSVSFSLRLELNPEIFYRR